VIEVLKINPKTPVPFMTVAKSLMDVELGGYQDKSIEDWLTGSHNEWAWRTPVRSRKPFEGEKRIMLCSRALPNIKRGKTMKNKMGEGLRTGNNGICKDVRVGE
jgi:hypothetical protein